jgi:hypothetical protein
MRKSPFTLIVASSLLVLTGLTGRAATLWDIDIFSEYLNRDNPEYSGYFDITSKYDPNKETITSAKAYFGASVDLGDDPFIDDVKISFLYLGGGLVAGDAFLTLDETGQLKYTFYRTAGDFFALLAKLMVETSPRATPDGGATLILLGSALAGIEMLRRRTARRRK